MSLFKRLRGQSPRRRAVVIGLDGTPHSLITRLMGEGVMPRFQQIARAGTLLPNTSVYPTVSSVAWSCYMTGRNPGQHGIYGFIDRRPGTYQVTIPTSRDMKSDTLWEIASRAGKRVIVMNVPVTYPPREVNGVLIGCFLSPSIDKAVYPPAVAQRLKAWGYRIDIDPWQARRDKDRLLVDFRETLARRAESMFHLMDEEDWDLAQCHVMETDRLHHFLWEEMATDHSTYAPAFRDCYAQIDQVLGQVWDRLDDDTTLIVLSDHGFCTLDYEVYVNTWLEQNGWLSFERVPADAAPKLEHIAPTARAYSLDPGRVFLHVRGREPRGCVSPGAEYEALRDELAQALLAGLRDPATGEPMLETVLRREDLYHGPCFDQAADLILVPRRGYDLKGAWGKDSLTFKGTELVGMHTYDDAMFYVNRPLALDRTPNITDGTPTVLDALGVAHPAGLDGVSVLAG
ncbi:MAG: alkaline phosphatase family protein [Chloroflexi bacterium]|nr:alkaline phosphatase family protein [Chloroflexota bacterium]MBU1747539.1 alkaline phosphatase family protein [Chloroflexota bacterium]MBU1880237.1 alkaline phosphatase family protein [Chloroflexota bacterium]